MDWFLDNIDLFLLAFIVLSTFIFTIIGNVMLNSLKKMRTLLQNINNAVSTNTDEVQRIKWDVNAIFKASGYSNDNLEKILRDNKKIKKSIKSFGSAIIIDETSGKQYGIEPIKD